MTTVSSSPANGTPDISIRVDLKLIADMVAPHSRVLDVGCGEGILLDYLNVSKQVDGRGIELSMSGVRAAVAHGLSVIQGDADTDRSSGKGNNGLKSCRDKQRGSDRSLP